MCVEDLSSPWVCQLHGRVVHGARRIHAEVVTALLDADSVVERIPEVPNACDRELTQFKPSPTGTAPLASSCRRGDCVVCTS